MQLVASYPRQEPDALIGPVRICAGARGNSRPYRDHPPNSAMTPARPQNPRYGKSLLSQKPHCCIGDDFRNNVHNKSCSYADSALDEMLLVLPCALLNFALVSSIEFYV